MMARASTGRGDEPAVRAAAGVARVMVGIILLALPACGSAPPSDPAPAPTSAPTKQGSPDPMSPRPTSRREADPGPPQRTTQRVDRGGTTALTVRVGHREFAAEVGDSVAARELLTQLPLRLRFRDHNGLEKIAALPRPLPLDGVPPGVDPVVDDLGYYAPTGELVLYYGDVGYFEGIVRLGRLDPALGALLKSGPDEIEVALQVD